jgi:hypothetical protein
MLTFTASQLAGIARGRAAEREPAWIESELRAGYADALVPVPQDVLGREIRACLDRCDELGLTSTADRLTFCALDIVAFPGFRELPQLPSLVGRFGGERDAVLIAIVTAAPPDFWNRLVARGEAVRRKRGLV